MITKKQLRSKQREEWDDKAECIAHLAAVCRRSADPAENVAFAVAVYAETLAALDRGDLEQAVAAARKKVYASSTS